MNAEFRCDLPVAVQPDQAAKQTAPCLTQSGKQTAIRLMQACLKLRQFQNNTTKIFVINKYFVPCIQPALLFVLWHSRAKEQEM